MADAQGKEIRPSRPASGIELATLGLPVTQIHLLIPGVAAAALLAWLTILLSRFIGVGLMGFQKSPVSPVMLAILCGLVIGNLFRLPEWLKPGLTFVVKKLLRLGIILLGIRLSILDVFRLGAAGVPIVMICIAGALVVTTLLNRWLRLSRRLGTLIAVGTSICGVSAIIAMAPVIDAEDEEVAYAVAVITIFGVIATLTYPYLANVLFQGDGLKAGLFLGTSVHDTSQVTGAALVYCDVYSRPETLNVATVAKLVRNVFMALVIPLMAFFHSKSRDLNSRKRYRIRKLLPLFIIGFVLLAVIRSIGDATAVSGGRAFGLWEADVWKAIHGGCKSWAVNLLVTALAGVGLSIKFKTMKGLGIKPFLIGLGAAFTVGLISYAAISLFGKFLLA